MIYTKKKDSVQLQLHNNKCKLFFMSKVFKDKVFLSNLVTHFLVLIIH